MRFGDIIEFKDENYGKLIGTVTGQLHEDTPTFHYVITVKHQVIEDEEDVKHRYTYELDKELSGRHYSFIVYPKDIIRIVKEVSYNKE